MLDWSKDDDFCSACGWSTGQQRRLDVYEQREREMNRKDGGDRAVPGVCNGQRERKALERVDELRRRLDAGEPLTCTEIAALLGISREAVRLIQKRAIVKLTLALHDADES